MRTPRRGARRALLVIAGLLGAAWVGFNAYAATVIARGGQARAEPRDPSSVGLAFTDVVYGERLPAWYVAGAPGQPVIVVVHGYGGNRSGTVAVGPPLHERGYGLLFVNLGYVAGKHRYGGGQREANEVGDAVSWARHNLDVPVVVLGFSGGGFAAVAAVARGAEAAAVISDSGFVSFRHEVAHRAHVPRAFTSLLPVLYPLVSGGGHAIDVARALDGRPLPVPALIIQGTADRTISPANGKRLARLTGGELWLLPGVGHADAFHHDERSYVSRVDAFIRSARRAV